MTREASKTLGFWVGLTVGLLGIGSAVFTAGQSQAEKTHITKEEARTIAREEASAQVALLKAQVETLTSTLSAKVDGLAKATDNQTKTIEGLTEAVLERR